MKYLTTLVCTALLATGASLVGYAAGTPGSQFWYALAGGACLGLYVTVDRA